MRTEAAKEAALVPFYRNTELFDIANGKLLCDSKNEMVTRGSSSF